MDEIDTVDAQKNLLKGQPSQQQQSWGLLISIVLIVLMVTVGAFYAWGKRIAQQQQLLPSSGAATSTP